MLFTQPNHFNWSVDNFGTYNDAWGTNCPGHANAHTKGANTALLAGIAHDAYGLTVAFAGGATVATSRRALTDILIDPAAGIGNAGSSWSVLINNLLTNSPTMGSTTLGVWFYFPIFIPAGTAIGAAHQDSEASTTALRVAVRVHGQPSRPDALNVGTIVQTLGADTSTTSGVAVTPVGSGVFGSYSASLGTLTNASWWWQLGIASGDASQNATSYLWDVAADATNKINCLREMPFANHATSEQSFKLAYGASPPFQHIGAGQDVYVRGVCANTTPDTVFTAVVYAVS